MKERKLTVPDGFNPASQRQVGSFVAQLDDQLKLLHEAVAGLEVRHLEWQPHPGVNTIGMLLAHLAVVETFWFNVGAAEMPIEPDGDNLILATIGIRMDDDGLPLAAGNHHPVTLSGKTLDDYLQMLAKSRRAIHQTLMGWTDADIQKSYQRRDILITREWTLYHVLEHFAAHFGQILLLKHLMRDAGLLPAAEK